ncbi:MAG TPA: ABC transporter permease, partial [Gemmata sp.]|nr:ABC transporter permease [Gemmata sp.]
MFGPLFRYELIRLARRGLQPRLRAAFALLLLAVLLLAYLAAFPGVGPLQLLTHIDEPLTTESAGRFGERFVSAFLLVQVAAVVLMTPAVVVGAVADERDRRAFDQLLATPLSAWEVLGGKLAARLVFLGTVLLTGLPVAVLSVFFGGVDVGRLLAGYAIALCTLPSLGAYSLYAAVRRPTTGGALAQAYAVALFLSAFGLVCSCFVLPAFVSPIGTTWVILSGWPGLFSPNPADAGLAVLCYAIVHFTVAAVSLGAAVSALRDPEEPPRPTAVLS